MAATLTGMVLKLWVGQKGAQRSEVVVCSCFGRLLCWVLSWWKGGGEARQQQLARPWMPARCRTALRCSASGHEPGCAIPVAWAIVPAWGKGAWQPIWLDLLDMLADRVPSDLTVIVLADRGLYARGLQHIQRLGWHLFLRINQGGKRVRWARTAITGRPPLLRCPATGGMAGALFYRGVQSPGLYAGRLLG